MITSLLELSRTKEYCYFSSCMANTTVLQIDIFVSTAHSWRLFWFMKICLLHDYCGLCRCVIYYDVYGKKEIEWNLRKDWNNFLYYHYENLSGLVFCFILYHRRGPSHLSFRWHFSFVGVSNSASHSLDRVVWHPPSLGLFKVRSRWYTYVNWRRTRGRFKKVETKYCILFN